MNINANDMHNANNLNGFYQTFLTSVIILAFTLFFTNYNFTQYNFTSFYYFSTNKMSPRANKNTSRVRVTGKLRRQWNAREKLAIIMYHEKGHSKNKTAARFNIQTKQVRDWVSKKDQLLKAQPCLKRLNKGRPPKYAGLEAALVEWVKERRNNQQAVSRNMIQVKARTFAQERG